MVSIGYSEGEIKTLSSDGRSVNAGKKRDFSIATGIYSALVECRVV